MSDKEKRRNELVKDLEAWLKRFLSLASDPTSKLRQPLSLRTAPARYYGIGCDLESKLEAFDQEARSLSQDLDELLPRIEIVRPDLVPQIAKADEALADLRTAVCEIETDRPASELWEDDLRKLETQVSEVRNGLRTTVTCPICGATYFFDSDQSSDTGAVEQHFTHHHRRPADAERQLIDPHIQIERFDSATRSCRELYRSAYKSLLSSDDDAVPEIRNDSARPARGRESHTWRSAIEAKYVERCRSGDVNGLNAREAEYLLSWVRDHALVPLLPREKPIDVKTISESWIPKMKKKATR